jgi:hypothetical protein
MIKVDIKKLKRRIFKNVDGGSTRPKSSKSQAWGGVAGLGAAFFLFEHLLVQELDLDNV